MILVDTNIFVHFFRGTHSKSTERLKTAFDDKQLLMNPFVLSELLSSPKISKKMEKYLLDLPRIEIDSSFFERAGFLRRKIYQLGKGVSMSDVYIAQACIDAKLPLLTEDEDLFLISQNSDLKIV